MHVHACSVLVVYMWSALVLNAPLICSHSYLSNIVKTSSPRFYIRHVPLYFSNVNIQAGANVQYSGSISVLPTWNTLMHRMSLD